MLATILMVVRKELLEILRDRRTLFLMIGIPVFLYPALFVLMEQVMLFGQGALGNVVPRVAVHRIAFPERPLPLIGDERIELVEVSNVDEQDLRSGRFDAVMIVDSAGTSEIPVLAVEILYDASRDRSVHARALLTSQLNSASALVLADRLDAYGLPPEFAEPIVVRDTSVATAEGLGGATLGRFLPMVLILMTVLGAFHPAIDVAAGERERRTLEPLLATSTPGSSIVIGKYLAVAIIAFNTAALNLVSMLLTLQAGLFKFASELGLEFDLPVSSIFLILGLLALLALLFAALFMGVAIHAQSFREAQTSLTPIYLVSFLPAIIVMAPGIEFTPGLALIPISGVALLFRTLMAGDPVGMQAFLAIGATIAYASLALSFAARAFAREDVLLGDEEAAEVGAARRPWWNRDAAPIPTPRVALLFVAFVGLLYFYVGISLQRWGEPGLLASQWLLLALPALVLVRIGRFDWRETLALRPAPPLAFAAGALIILGGLPFGWFLAWVQTFFLSVPSELLAGMQTLLTGTDALRLTWLLLIVAITPALCEELVFRGVLLQGFQRKITPLKAVLASSFVFGLFHLSFETAIRFLPTMFLGALLAIVVVRTRSVLTSMMMHFINNAMAVLLVSIPAMQTLVLSESGNPKWALLPVGAILLTAGFMLLRRVDAAGAPDSEAGLKRQRSGPVRMEG